MDGIKAYRENAVVTQSRGRLIVLLYEGAIKFIKQAMTEIEAGDWAAKGQSINRAAAIIEELDACLNVEQGGEVAQNLRRLYFFMLGQLHKANFRRDKQMLAEVVGLLEELNDSWRTISL